MLVLQIKRTEPLYIETSDGLVEIHLAYVRGNVAGLALRGPQQVKFYRRKIYQNELRRRQAEKEESRADQAIENNRVDLSSSPGDTASSTTSSVDT